MAKKARKAKYDPSKRPKKIYSKGWQTRRKNAQAKISARTVTEPQLNELANVANLEQPLASAHPDFNEAPGRGEIVGGEASRLVEQIAKLSRKKNSGDEMQKLAQEALAHMHAVGAAVGERGARELNDRYRAAIDNAIVCAFIAEFDHGDRHQRPDDTVWVSSAFVVRRIVTALKQAGYSGRGLREGR